MGTKISDQVIIVKRSRKSIRGFIRLFLGINATKFWFHQTLTFKDNKTDEVVAKRYLMRLLDTLRKQFPQMPAVYVQERQQRLGIHYHVIFVMFGTQALSPQDLRQSLEPEIFRRWKRITGGQVVKQGNKLTLPTRERRYGLAYLLGGVEMAKASLPREPNWYGYSLGNIIKANSTEVTKRTVSEAWDYALSFRKTVQALTTARPPTKRRYTTDDIAGMKAYLEWTGAAGEWKQLRSSIAGRKITSDEEFCSCVYPAEH